MSVILFSCDGGHLVLPDRASLLVGRENGGNLVVNPPRPVWERSELTPQELSAFAFLVAAAGRAMIDVLPQLEGGCINYWEAGNWALNDAAEPTGRKDPRTHRKMHLHLLGRSPASTDPAWAWGESPIFPRFADKASAAAFDRLTAAECYQIVSRADTRLRTTYGLMTGQIAAWSPCDRCAYPAPVALGESPHLCAECRLASGAAL
jgi:diadenosine tetraphosphate (Ap4A) HIT family hydrolase